MKTKTHMFILGFAILFISQCTFSPISKIDKVRLPDHNKIYIGWLDLGEDNWTTFRYASKENWLEVIKIMNGYLKEHCEHTVRQRKKSYYTGDVKYHLRFAQGPNDESFEDAQLYLKFSKVSLGGGTEGFKLDVTVQFIDIATGKVLYSLNYFRLGSAWHTTLGNFEEKLRYTLFGNYKAYKWGMPDYYRLPTFAFIQLPYYCNNYEQGGNMQCEHFQ